MTSTEKAGDWSWLWPGGARLQEKSFPWSPLARFVPILFAFLISLPAAGQPLISAGSTWKYFEGTQEVSSPATAWRQPAFNDAAWPSGPAPFRYGDGTGGTLLSAMQNRYSSMFLRQWFVVTNAATIENLRVGANYDDGFIVWLNGTEIFRLNGPTNSAWNAVASTNHESGTFETYTLSGAGNYVVNGTNVLAVQACNITTNSSDFYFDLALEGTTPQPVLSPTRDTRFSINRGFYQTNLTVIVSSDTAGATITYTLDGSDPRISATAQRGPTPVSVLIDPTSTYGGRRARLTPAVTLRAYASKEGRAPSNVDTHTYIYPDRVRAQDNVVDPGLYVFWDTVIDSRVVNDPRYNAGFNAALQDIPTVSVVMNWEDLFGTNGIHRGNNLNNHSLEKACSIEWIYPSVAKFTGLAGFQVNGGIKIQGGGGRWDEGRYAPKQSFTLLFQPSFDGPGRLKYPLFEAAPLNRESDAGEYNRVILRAGHNKSWPGPGPNLRETVVYTRDEYFRASHLALSGKGGSSHGTFAHLYLNGLYWGLYNTVERPDHGFLSIHFGGDGEHYDSYKQRNGDPNGDRNRLTAAQTIAANTNTPYATVKEYVDTAQFIDFMIVTWSGGAADGPQWYAGNARNPVGPVRWFCWDYEDSFTPPGAGRGGAGYTWTEVNPLWTSIRSHLEFRMELADRLYKHCFNDGEFTDAKNTDRWLALAAYIENAVVGESARWGDQGVSSRNTPNISGYTPPLNRNDHWYNARDLVTGILQGNTAKMINDLRARGYFPSANATAPLFFDAQNREIRVSRLTFTNSFTIRLARSGNTGTIFWSTNGPDPRAEGGTVQGLEGGTGTNLVITGTTTIRARVRYGTEWSPVHVLTLHAASQDLSGLKITEIMYHPAGTELAVNRAVSSILGDAGGPDSGRALIRLAVNAPASGFSSGDELVLTGALIPQNNGTFTVERVSGRDVYLDQTLVDETPSTASASMYLGGERYEFIELKNAGPSPLNLSGVRFTAGIQYAFPEGTILGSGQFWLLTPHRSNFRDRYPAVAVSGQYMGSLDNGGERLTIEDPFTNVITTVNYTDRAPWPVSPDGFGYSLVTVQPDPAGTQDDVTRWRASQNTGGSPVADDPLPTVPAIKVNEVLTHTDPPLSDAIELFNPTSQPVELGGWYLTDERTQPRRWRIPDGIRIPANSHYVFYEGHYAGTTLLAATNEFGSSFALSALGEEVYLFSPTLAYSHGFEFGGAFNGVTFGRHPISSGEEHFPPQLTRTLGNANAGPVVGPVVISEIHYFPAEGGDEFLELRNLTSQPVPLYDPAFPTNSWKLNGVGFEFEAGGVTLPPFGFALLVRGDATAPATFRSKYSIPAGVPIYSYEAALDNNGETLTLRRPDEPVRTGPEAGAVPYVEVERVRFGPLPPWPSEPAGLGPSLERVDADLFGNEPLNWRPSASRNGTPGLGSEPVTTPLIDTDPASLVVTAVVGTDPGMEELNVWNRGVSTLYYEISSDSPLVTITPRTELSTGPGDRKLHYIQFRTAALPLGTHQLTLEVRDNGSGAPNSPVVIPVTLQIVPPPMPKIGLGSDTIRLRSRSGQNAAPSSLTIYNAGTGVLLYTLESDAEWIAAVPQIGSSADVTDARTHAISFNTASLPVGAYAGRIHVNAPAALNAQSVVWVILEVLDGTEFIAYNDFSWGLGQTTTNITTHTTAQGGGGGSGGGELVDYATGLPTGIGLEVSGGSWLGASHAVQGRLSHAGTDAFGVFSGIVDCQGVLSYAATELLLSLTNLDSRAVYEIVLFGNRDNYAARFTTLTLEGAVTFTNLSTQGAVITGTSGATTRLSFGQNTTTGQVARYADVIPGPDGRCTLRIPAATAAEDTQYYLNALAVRAKGLTPPYLRLETVTDGWLMLSWEEGTHLEEASTPHGPWIPSDMTNSPSMVPASEATRYFRLRAQP